MKRARKITQLLIILTTVVFAVSTANAEMLTLRGAIETALKQNPQLRAYTWKLQGQEEELKIAKGYLYPKIKAEESLLNTDNPTYSFMAKLNQERLGQEDFYLDSLNNPDPVNDFRTSLSFEMPLYVPRIYSGIDLARRELKAKKAEYKRKKEAVVLNVIRTYLMTRTAGGYVDAALKGLEDAREHVRLAELRYKGGTGLYSDLLRAKVAVKEAEAMVVKAESNLETAKRALGLLLGRDGKIEVTGDIPILPLNELDTYINAATARQDLSALKLRHENSLKAGRNQPGCQRSAWVENTR
ncbi:MAG: TolC family protein [Nitrospirae bacterium]|nr:TolC family protein [Nitrospirota bacterium]